MRKKKRQIDFIDRVELKTGRLVDGVKFCFLSGQNLVHGGFEGGETESYFELKFDKYEFIVRVNGRQGKHLDGIQFVTNYGRTSPWYGGGGGNSFQFTAQPGYMIIGLQSAEPHDQPSPLIVGLQTAKCPKTKQASLIWLLTNKRTRNLVFSGKPSLFKLSTRKQVPTVHAPKNRSSILRLALKRPAILWLLLKGKPCLARLLLTGEENLGHRNSLLRSLCADTSYKSIEGKNLIQVLLDGGDKQTPSLMKLFLIKQRDKKLSLAQEFLASDLSKVLFDSDTINGFPSILQLLLEEDEFWQGTKQKSCLELLLSGEHGIETDQNSILRIFITSNTSHDSLFAQMIASKNQSRSIMAHLLYDKDKNGLSITRRMLTSFEDHRGYKPSIFRYILLGETETPRRSFLRNLISGEDPSRNQFSILRELLYKHSYNAKISSQGAVDSSDGLRSLVTAGDERVGRSDVFEKKSLFEILVAGEVSLLDVILDGELTGEDSLARFFLTMSVRIEHGVLKLDDDIEVTEDTRLRFTLADLCLLGEEEDGPGISLLRLFLLGETENGFSLLRLMLLNETNDDSSPSFFRLLLTAVRTVLVALKQPKSDVSQWSANIGALKNVVLRSQKQGIASTFSGLVKSITDGVFSGISQYSEILGLLLTIPNRGEEFGMLWKTQWTRIGEELNKISTRVKRDDSNWKTFGPVMGQMCFNLADQKWVAMIQLIPDVILSFSKLINDYTRKTIELSKSM